MNIRCIDDITFYCCSEKGNYFNSYKLYLRYGSIMNTGNDNILVLSQLNLAADIDKEN